MMGIDDQEKLVETTQKQRKEVKTFFNAHMIVYDEMKKDSVALREKLKRESIENKEVAKALARSLKKK